MNQSTGLQPGARPAAARPWERRLMGHALARWDNLRGNRRFPRPADRLGFGLSCPPESLFLIRLGRVESDDRIVEAGDALGRALDLDPVGRKAVEVLPSSRQLGLCLHRAAADFKKPTADVWRFLNRHCDEVRYRCVLLPLSEDGRRVDHVLGAFNYKIVAKV